MGALETTTIFELIRDCLLSFYKFIYITFVLTLYFVLFIQIIHSVLVSSSMLVISLTLPFFTLSLSVSLLLSLPISRYLFFSLILYFTFSLFIFYFISYSTFQHLFIQPFFLCHFSYILILRNDYSKVSMSPANPNPKYFACLDALLSVYLFLR